MVAVRIILLWWVIWMAVEGFWVYFEWPRYVKMYNATKRRRRSAERLPIVTILYVLLSPGVKIFQICKVLFLSQQYRVQMNIYRYNGNNREASSDIRDVSDGEEIAINLMESDRTIRNIYYQVVVIYDEGVLDAKMEEEP
jgi:hypothetical protein